MEFVDVTLFSAWLASSLNLLELTFGAQSSFTQRLEKIIAKSNNENQDRKAALGLLTAAAEDYERGYLTSLRREISDELIIDLCLSAESLVADGRKEPAAVLAAAALEDCLRRRAEDNGVWKEGNGLSENANALKTVGVLSGATAKMVPSWNKFRNNAMHADWAQITEAEITGVTGFLKTFVV